MCKVGSWLVFKFLNENGSYVEERISKNPYVRKTRLYTTFSGLCNRTSKYEIDLVAKLYSQEDKLHLQSSKFEIRRKYVLRQIKELVTIQKSDLEARMRRRTDTNKHIKKKNGNIYNLWPFVE